MIEIDIDIYMLYDISQNVYMITTSTSVPI